MKKFIKMMALTAAAIGMSAGAAVAEPLKVGFLYLTTPGDHGWTYAHELARQEVQAHFGDKVETTFVENVPEGPDAERVVRELARQGNQVIFGTSFGYMDPMLKVSKDFPDVKFEHITGLQAFRQHGYGQHSVLRGPLCAGHRRRHDDQDQQDRLHRAVPDPRGLSGPERIRHRHA